MKQFKRVIALVIAAVMLMSLASCSMTDNGETDITRDNIRIGVILSGAKDSATGDAAYAMAAINEVLNLGYGIGSERFNCTVENVDPDNADAVAAALTEVVNKECNLVIATEAGYLDDIQKISGGDNEDMKFFVCDADNDGKNIYGYKADMSATMYFTGLVAGMKAAALENPKLGFIAESEDSTLVNAFAMGAKAADPAATVSVVYSTDAAAAADKLIKEGCVVLASDYEDESVAKAATDAKIFFCGFGTETYANATNEETGEKLYASAFLCAPLYNYAQFYIDAIKAVVDDKEPAPFVGGFLEGITYLTDLNDATVAEGTQEALNAAIASLEKAPFAEDAFATADNVTVVK